MDCDGLYVNISYPHEKTEKISINGVHFSIYRGRWWLFYHPLEVLSFSLYVFSPSFKEFKYRSILLESRLPSFF